MTISYADVQTAKRILAGAALRTAMLPSPKLSALTGAEVFVKFENLQVTNSFKDRGAYVKLASLSEAQCGRGVIAMSIGNHAQAVAYHSQRLGIPATIVMPVTTPFAKVKTTEAYGAKVVLEGETLGRVSKARCRHCARPRAHPCSPLRRSCHHRWTGHSRARDVRGDRRSSSLSDLTPRFGPR
jgi:threonine dehydratase